MGLGSHQAEPSRASPSSPPLPSAAIPSLPRTVCLENDSQECSKILMDEEAGLQYRKPLQDGEADGAGGPGRLAVRGALCAGGETKGLGELQALPTMGPAVMCVNTRMCAHARTHRHTHARTHTRVGPTAAAPLGSSPSTSSLDLTPPPPGRQPRVFHHFASRRRTVGG